MSNWVVECPQSKAYFIGNTATHFYASTWLSLKKVHVVDDNKVIKKNVDELKSVRLIKSQFMNELIIKRGKIPFSK